MVSHAHADHAYPGMKRYAATPVSAAVMRLRLGANIVVDEYDYGVPFLINGVTVSLHPAGHVPGSAQIRIEHKGRVWIATGDYKREFDGISTAFEQLEGEGIITEGTFALPVYAWKSQATVMAEIDSWWQENANAGKASVLYGYSLGKAQRVLAALAPLANGRPMYGHGAVINVTDVLRNAGVPLPPLEHVGDDRLKTKTDYTGALIIAPPSTQDSAWTKRFGDFEDATVSGWAALRASRRWRNMSRGFVMSDHADWQGLIKTVDDSKATYAGVFCGYRDTLSRYLAEERGLEVAAVPQRKVNDAQTPETDLTREEG